MTDSPPPPQDAPNPAAMPPPPPAGAVPPGPGMAPNPYEQKATPIMVIGIVSLVLLFFCGPLGGIAGIVAWVMGNNLRRDAQAAGFAEPGQAKAGRIMGMISTIFMIVIAAILVLLVVTGGFASS